MAVDGDIPLVHFGTLLAESGLAAACPAFTSFADGDPALEKGHFLYRALLRFNQKHRAIEMPGVVDDKKFYGWRQNTEAVHYFCMRVYDANPYVPKPVNPTLPEIMVENSALQHLRSIHDSSFDMIDAMKADDAIFRGVDDFDYVSVLCRALAAADFMDLPDMVHFISYLVAICVYDQGEDGASVNMHNINAEAPRCLVMGCLLPCFLIVEASEESPWFTEFVSVLLGPANKKIVEDNAWRLAILASLTMPAIIFDEKVEKNRRLEEKLDGEIAGINKFLGELHNSHADGYNEAYIAAVRAVDKVLALKVRRRASARSRPSALAIKDDLCCQMNRVLHTRTFAAHTKSIIDVARGNTDKKRKHV